MKAEQSLPADTGSILDILGFVEYHVLPLDPLKVLLVLGNLQRYQHAYDYIGWCTHQLVARDNDMEGGVLIVTDLLSAPKLS